MKYTYVCDTCGKTMIVEQSMKDSLKKNIPCECGKGKMNQDFKKKLKTLQTDLPEDFKSQSEYHSRDFSSGSSSALEDYMGGNI